jgi:hypothetical protein
MEPGPGAVGTTYLKLQRPTAVYLIGLWSGTRPRPISRKQLGRDLAYWRLAAIVTADSPAPVLVRFLDAEFGRPEAHSGDVFAWKPALAR